MSDLSVDIRIKKELESGANVHAWAFCVGDSSQKDVAMSFARALLPFGWVGEENTDLFFVGDPAKPANIEECREFMQEVALKPVASPWRVGVICAADKLLLPAANSLLKITEEPPSHVKLLFLMQTNGLLPTLRSRVRFISLLSPIESAPSPMPKSDSEWLEWFRASGELPDITATLGEWVEYVLRNGDSELAFKIEKLRLMLDGGKITKAMACDLVLLALKERVAIENLFGSFW